MNRGAIVSFIICFLIIGALVSNRNSDSQEKLSAATDRPQTAHRSPQSQQERQTATYLQSSQRITSDIFTLRIPKEWEKDRQSQLWFPITEEGSRTLPNRSLYIGAQPLMGNRPFGAVIRNHIGVDYEKPIPVQKCGMEGVVCQWQQGGKKSIGLFLLEKDSGIDLMHYFIYQAPAGSFDQDADIYKNILRSIAVR